MIEQKGLLSAIRDITDLPDNVRKALVVAINSVVPEAYSLSVDRITEQVALTKTYVKSRLYVSQTATVQDPMAIISGRVRSTQLRRYQGTQLYAQAKLPGKRRLAGTSVRVKAGGQTKVLNHAWVIKLKYGEVDAKAGMTTGIAMRTGPRRNDYRILYGPSVDQIFRDVKDEIRPEVEQMLSDEVLKQMAGVL